MFCTACATFNPTAGCCARCGVDLGGSSVSRRSSRGGLRAKVRRVLAVVPVLAVIVAAGGYYRAESAAPAARYAEAEAAVAAGRYDDALTAFGEAAGYRDAAARHARLNADLALRRAAYPAAMAALDEGQHDTAIAALLPVLRALPADEEVGALVTAAQERRLAALRVEADAAQRRGDWLGAERALAALAADDPDDSLLAERLTALRRAHAPLIFARDRALYLIGPDGRDERLVTDAVNVAEPTWSPDRTRIAFVSPESMSPFANATLYVVNPDGTGLTPLGDRIHPDAAPVWSPDGTRIAYTSAASFNLETRDGFLSVRMVNIATRRETDLTGATRRHATSPTWSPTGDRLAVISRPVATERGAYFLSGRGEVHVVTLATGAITDLSGGRLPSAWSIWWSPTAERLLLHTRSRVAPTVNRPRTFGILLVNTLTGNATQVVPDGPDTMPPVWSPTGARFAVLEGGTTLRIVPVDPAVETVEVELPTVAADPPSLPTWVPDGSALFVPAASPQESVVVPLGPGEAPIPVLAPLDYDNAAPTFGPPRWSPFNPADLPGRPTMAGTALDP